MTAVISQNAARQPGAPPRCVPAGTPSDSATGMPVITTATALPWRAGGAGGGRIRRAAPRRGPRPPGREPGRHGQRITRRGGGDRVGDGEGGHRRQQQPLAPPVRGGRGQRDRGERRTDRVHRHRLSRRALARPEVRAHRGQHARGQGLGEARDEDGGGQGEEGGQGQPGRTRFLLPPAFWLERSPVSRARRVGPDTCVRFKGRARAGGGWQVDGTAHTRDDGRRQDPAGEHQHVRQRLMPAGGRERRLLPEGDHRQQQVEGVEHRVEVRRLVRLQRRRMLQGEGDRADGEQRQQPAEGPHRPEAVADGGVLHMAPRPAVPGLRGRCRRCLASCTSRAAWSSPHPPVGGGQLLVGVRHIAVPSRSSIGGRRSAGSCGVSEV
ncbi:hypothetical protein SGLAM104S_04635 [Streptomyces glaucescens]